MKKIITISVLAITVFAAAYMVAQGVNSKSVSAYACKSDGTDYCQ